MEWTVNEWRILELLDDVGSAYRLCFTDKCFVQINDFANANAESAGEVKSWEYMFSSQHPN
jgi:hypothetical protein